MCDLLLCCAPIITGQTSRDVRLLLAWLIMKKRRDFFGGALKVILINWIPFFFPSPVIVLDSRFLQSPVIVLNSRQAGVRKYIHCFTFIFYYFIGLGMLYIAIIELYEEVQV